MERMAKCIRRMFEKPRKRRAKNDRRKGKNRGSRRRPGSN